MDAGLNTLRVLESEGKTSVLVVRESDRGVSVLGWLAFTDTVRPGAADMIERLRALGVDHIVMLTGDNERVANRIAEEVGIDREKTQHELQQLKQKGEIYEPRQDYYRTS